MKDVLVLKYGSEAVTNGQGVDMECIGLYSDDIQEAQERYNTIVVSSGAAAMGRWLWEEHGGGEEMPTPQEQAMMGSAYACIGWQSELLKRGIFSGQLLTTHHEIEDKIERPVLSEALYNCFERGIVPIVNENDALSIKELAKLAFGGDNDGIAAHIARLVGAKHLILFTKRGGFFDEDRQEVREIRPEQRSWALDIAKRRQTDRQAKGKKGRGGMPSKLHHGFKAADAGTGTHIARAGARIEAVLDGEEGTYLAPAA